MSTLPSVPRVAVADDAAVMLVFLNADSGVKTLDLLLTQEPNAAGKMFYALFKTES